MPQEVRILQPEEYPYIITAPHGAYTPDIQFAARTSHGMYYIDRKGSGRLQTYFRPRGARERSRSEVIGPATSMQGAYERILDHHDQLLHPDEHGSPGQHGPVSVSSLSTRIGPRPTSQLEEEIRRVCATPAR